MMINKTIIILAFLFLLTPSAVPETTPPPAVPSTTKAVPVIKFEQESFDVGNTWEGEKASHTFSFKNIGDAILHIKKVKTSCGCTAAILSSKDIKPGESGEIEATFSTKRYRGKQSKTIYVSSNDPDHPTVQLKIQTTIKSVGSFNPRNIQFGQVTRGEKVSRVVEFTPEVDNIEITEITATPEIFSARLLEDKEGTTDNNPEANKIRPIRIEVSVSPETPIGRHNGNLTVTVNQPRISTLSSRLYLRVEGPITFSPRMLFFDENAQKKQSVKKIRLTMKTGANLEIIGLESTSPYFQASTVEIAPGREFDIEIGMAPNIEPGRYQGEIVIRTDCPDQEEIKIPVRSNIQKK